MEVISKLLVWGHPINHINKNKAIRLLAATISPGKIMLKQQLLDLAQKAKSSSNNQYLGQVAINQNIKLFRKISKADISWAKKNSI